MKKAAKFMIHFGQFASGQKIPATSFEEVRRIVNRRAAKGVSRVIGRVFRVDTGTVMAEFWTSPGHPARFHRLDTW